MKKQRPKYETPPRPWVKERIEREKKLLEAYGLRRKREIWRAEAILRGWRRRARELAARRDEEAERVLLTKLLKLGLVKEGASLDDVLGLTVENLLDRRLQTLVYKKGFANTLMQARQFIVHGHIAVDGTRTRWPSMIVPVSLENKIGFYEKSKVKKWLMASKAKEAKKEKVVKEKGEEKEEKSGE